ncbi:hypothetical protein J6590_029565 [Homalodisca vitripennis]|nr:hypothetical protein J6590_029565 [Homalodisca vitripennis]
MHGRTIANIMYDGGGHHALVQAELSKVSTTAAQRRVVSQSGPTLYSTMLTFATESEAGRVTSKARRSPRHTEARPSGQIAVTPPRVRCLFWPFLEPSALLHLLAEVQRSGGTSARLYCLKPRAVEYRPSLAGLDPSLNKPTQRSIEGSNMDCDVVARASYSYYTCLARRQAPECTSLTLSPRRVMSLFPNLHLT